MHTKMVALKIYYFSGFVAQKRNVCYICYTSVHNFDCVC